MKKKLTPNCKKNVTQNFLHQMLKIKIIHQIKNILHQTQKTVHQTFGILHQIRKVLHQTQNNLHQTFKILHQIIKILYQTFFSSPNQKNFTPN